ncbi:putative molybdopterin biosynthesis protein MoeB [Neisseria sp. oral taxon 020 str. F0370]|uniref:HesA/MoeB/ThiF family protein n=1 Tax=unclassified Neisseria TaxID=2623750 RepID=UPI0002A392B5|nr:MULTISPECIES: HesA/MoeB/ThiF family protein [unclassified Neisseria]ASP17027.1 molybdopterin-synthase adenylyltransferase MoeB [Neisseria sp. KEM232]EKY06424.1 putative molybdopterin biosynthesis protein MoeB [Neisseria sp. oral taxon 020 str. F0370]
MDDRDLLRYSRHILLDEIGIEGQEKLLSATALVIGCGGLGAAALPYLAAAGIGRLNIADGDTVDETNLQRQTAFGEADIGRNKAQALADRLKSINSRCTVRALPDFLDAERLAQHAAEADIVLDCCDNFATRQAVNRACVYHKKPLVSGAAVRFDGQLAVYRPDLPDSPCYACLFDGETADDGACALFGVFAPLVGIIGTMQAAAALNVLLGTGTPAHGTLQTYNALGGRWHSFAIPKDPHCRVCGCTSQKTV